MKKSLRKKDNDPIQLAYQIHEENDQSICSEKLRYDAFSGHQG